MRYYKKNKYRNKETKVGNITYDSKKEADYCEKLKIREKAGEIKNLVLQPKFDFSIDTPQGKEYLRYCNANGKNERKVTYRADFQYKTLEGKLIVGDVKSKITKKNRAYRIKKALMKLFYNIEVLEV